MSFQRIAYGLGTGILLTTFSSLAIIGYCATHPKEVFMFAVEQGYRPEFTEEQSKAIDKCSSEIDLFFKRESLEVPEDSIKNRCEEGVLLNRLDCQETLREIVLRDGLKPVSSDIKLFCENQYNRLKLP
jgi:hypothetical protein